MKKVSTCHDTQIAGVLRSSDESELLIFGSSTSSLQRKSGAHFIDDLVGICNLMPYKSKSIIFVIVTQCIYYKLLPSLRDIIWSTKGREYCVMSLWDLRIEWTSTVLGLYLAFDICLFPYSKKSDVAWNNYYAKWDRTENLSW